jgi:predicted signal transduction protein with EAL and GGDEF domain
MNAILNTVPLRIASSVGDLLFWNTTVELQIKTADVEQCFLADPTLPGVIITANRLVIGILSRENLMAAISRPFGRDVFIKRPVSELLKMIDTTPLVLPAGTPIAAALKSAMARPSERCFEPFLVEHNNFFGLLEMNALLNAQAILLEEALRSKDELIEEVERTASELRRTLEEQKRLAQELSHAKEVAQYEATHDSLTGLPNRKLFLERLKIALSTNQADPAQDCSVLFIDLDRFKIVNDSLGHLAGNDLLKEVANRLNQLIGKYHPPSPGASIAGSTAVPHPADTIARLSGDEFTVLLAEKTSRSAAISFANGLQDALCKPFNIGVEAVVVSASIGIVSSLSGYDNTEEILRDADIAMYRAKDQGKACAVIFEPSMRTQVETRLHIENRLRDAIAKQEFELHYQPIIHLQTGSITGLEALIRWRGPDALIFPDVFFDIAEETGLIVPLGNWVFREACDALRNINSTCVNGASVNMSINLSALQFNQIDLAEALEELVIISGVTPEMITIEITERSTMANPDRALVTLNRLKSIGFRLAIDDFGTGYSSLSYLHRFPIDILKIDRFFISNLDDSSDSEKIVVSILALADSLGMTVVAEGVETVHQLECLKKLGCKFAQGYLFAKALPQAQIETLFRTSSPIFVRT